MYQPGVISIYLCRADFVAWEVFVVLLEIPSKSQSHVTTRSRTGARDDTVSFRHLFTVLKILKLWQNGAKKIPTENILSKSFVTGPKSGWWQMYRTHWKKKIFFFVTWQLKVGMVFLMKVLFHYKLLLLESQTNYLPFETQANLICRLHLD